MYKRQRSAQPREDAQVALYLADLEKNLSGRMGRKVHIVHGRKKGRIELEYYDEQDLEALLRTLGYSEEGL